MSFGVKMEDASLKLLYAIHGTPVEITVTNWVQTMLFAVSLTYFIAELLCLQNSSHAEEALKVKTTDLCYAQKNKILFPVHC